MTSDSHTSLVPLLTSLLILVLLPVAAVAQFSLGVMYSKGRGVPQDYVQAHMWVNLAAAQGNEQAQKTRDRLPKQMTPAQMDEAQRLAREWKPKQ